MLIKQEIGTWKIILTTFVTLKKNANQTFLFKWMNFMNSSLYFSFRNHILNFLIDYLNCLPNMLKYEANARKKNYHVSTWWEYVVLVYSSILNLPIMKWRLRTTINMHDTHVHQMVYVGAELHVTKNGPVILLST